MSVEIPIVIVSYNDLLGLENCLDSIFRMNDECKKSEIVAKVILIDNASCDNNFKVINNYKNKIGTKKFSNINARAKQRIH